MIFASCRAAPYADEALVAARRAGSVADDVGAAAGALGDEAAALGRGAGSLTDEAGNAARTAGSTLGEAAAGAAVVAASSADDAVRLRSMVAAQGDDLLRTLSSSTPLRATEESTFMDVFTELVCLYADKRDPQDIEQDVARLFGQLNVALTPPERLAVIGRAYRTSEEVQAQASQLATTITVATVLGCTLDN